MKGDRAVWKVGLRFSEGNTPHALTRQMPNASDPEQRTSRPATGITKEQCFSIGASGVIALCVALCVGVCVKEFSDRCWWHFARGWSSCPH
jgi:hypothetical protein